ncbi:MAG: anion permease [Chloroflexi bacterium]|nr:anion permease [Chloroflexota bacterium]
MPVSPALAKALTALGIGTLILALPAPDGLSATGQRALAVGAVSVVLWATEALPTAVTSLLVVVLLVLAGAAPKASAALFGFSQPVGYFVIGTLGLGTAVFRSGLAARLAGFALRGADGSAVRLYTQLLVVTMPLALVLPSAITRNAVLMPAYLETFRRLGYQPGAPLPRAITLQLAAINPAASSALLTGGVAPVVVAGLVGGFTWLGWFAMLALPYYAVILLGGAVTYLLVRPPLRLPDHAASPFLHGDESDYAPAPRSGAPTKPPLEATSSAATITSKPLVAAELKTLLVLAGVSALWLLDFLHGWHPAVPALFGLVALVAPGIGVITWADLEDSSPWPLFLLLGASLSLAEALRASGASTWLASLLAGAVAPTDPLPVVVAKLVLLATAFGVLLPNRAGALSVLVPIVMSYAGQHGLRPEILAFVVLMAVDVSIFYPAQSPTSMLAYQGRFYRPVDLLFVGLALVVILEVVLLTIALPYWNVIGATSPLR